ncbi:MAG: protein kinase [Chloroflexota bacterium]|nr:protein kinase [Chloroflexota bacterium]
MMETVPRGTILHGRYRIERVLGSGGFGHVYLVREIQTSQPYAIKEYLVTGPNGQAQLQHEAQVLSQLHHPSLPAFHEAFYERGHYYVVLSYIEGNDLTELIRVTRQRNTVIPLSRILEWMLSVSDAVSFLHNHHPPVIHRDIKPDNIRIMPNGTAMLVDLGNAKEVADGARTLFFIRHQGTPGYAPQEQYPGGAGTDARSDVYALGATLYFALTAHEPPSVSTRNQARQQRLPDLPSLQEQVANNPPEESAGAQSARQFRLGVSKPAKPVPLHLRHLAQLGTLPPERLAQLNSVIAQAMAMEQKNRYQSVKDFSDALRQVVAALPQQPASPSRSVDPHSTQPDLPQLYEAIQAAKSNSGVPGSDEASYSTNTCPHCGTIYVSGTSFCPGCGFSLPRAVQPSLSGGGDSRENIHPPVQQNPTIQANLADNNASNASQLQTPSPVLDPAPPVTPNYKIPQTPPTTAQGNQPLTTKSTSAISSNRRDNRTAQPPGTNFFSKGVRLALLLIIVFILLIIVFIFLLVSLTGKTHSGFHDIQQLLALAGQIPTYYG